MLSLFPDEILLAVAKFCSMKTLAHLACTNRHFHNVFNQVLYQYDTRHNGSSSIYHAIAQCEDQTIAIGILRAAVLGGAELRHCRDLHHQELFRGPITCLAVHSPIMLAAKYGRDQIIEFLLDHDIPVDGPKGLAYRPLFLAIKLGNETAAKVLASRGALLENGPFNMNALQFSIWHGLSNLPTYLTNVVKMNINQRSIKGESCIKLALTSSRPVEMVSLVLSLGFDLVGHLLEACHCAEDWAQFPELLWPKVPVYITGSECLQMIYFISTRQTRKALKSVQINAICSLIATLLEFAAKADPVVLEHAHHELQCLLRRMLSVDRGNLDIAALLIYRYGFKVDYGIITDILAKVTSTKFQQKRHQALKDHPMLLKSLDFLLTYCGNPKYCGDGAVLFFLNQVPCEVVEIVRDLKVKGFSLTGYGLKKSTMRR